MLFETNRYFVRTRDDQAGYEVVNKETGVVEADLHALPRAIIAAEEYTYFFDKREEESRKIKEVKGEVIALSSRQDRSE